MQGIKLYYYCEICDPDTYYGTEKIYKRREPKDNGGWIPYGYDNYSLNILFDKDDNIIWAKYTDKDCTHEMTQATIKYKMDNLKNRVKDRLQGLGIPYDKKMINQMISDKF